jgi:hypothetical protein
MEGKRAELDLQLLQQMGVDVTGLRLEQPRAGSSSTKKLAATSSSDQQ